MRRLLLPILLAIAPAALAQPVTTPSGETKQLCRVWDGTDVMLVDGSGNVGVTGTLTCNAGSGTLAISATQLPAALGANGALKIEGVASGTVVPISGTVTITDGAGAVNVIVDSGTIAATQSGAWNITNVSGTVSLPTGASTSALQDGIVKDGSGDTTQANVSSGRLHVDPSGVTSPVSAASLPLPTGASTLAEQQTQTTSLSVMDDWDDSDRAKVNPIAGQAGVQGGAGASTALTQRVALATDANTIQGTVTANAGTGTFDVSCVSGCTPGGSFADNDAFTFDTTAVSNTAFVVDDVATNTITENSAGAGRMSTNRIPYFSLHSDAGTALLGQTTMAGSIPVALASNQSALTVDGSGVTQPVSATNLDIRDLTHASDSVKIGDGTDLALVSGSGSLQVTCDNCGGSTFADDDPFTGGSSSILPIGALYDTTPPAITDGSAGIPRMNSSRALLVDGSGATQPVSGTFWQATQPVSGTVAVSGTVTVSDGAGALNVIVDSSALPSGAATSANQDGIIRDGTGDTTQANVASGRLSVDGSGVTQPISGTVTTSPPSNASTNITQVAGTAIDVNSGTKSAGTVRVVLATDQPALTNKLLVTPDSVALPANQSVNVAQMNGVATTMGNGADGTGVQRVTIANNSTGIIALTTGSAQIGHLEANQSVNLAQVAGATTATGNGTASGSIRVSVASDSTGQIAVASLPNEGQQTAANSISVTQDTDNDAIGATGAAPPGEVIDIGGRTSGADTTGLMTGITVCDSVAVVNISSATTTLVITGVSARHWRICSLNLVAGAAQGVALISGTGATCGTSTAAVNGGTTGATGWQFAANGGLTQGSGIGEIMSSKVSGGATGDSMCIVTSTTGQLSGAISYAIF